MAAVVHHGKISRRMSAGSGTDIPWASINVRFYPSKQAIRGAPARPLCAKTEHPFGFEDAAANRLNVS